MLMPKNTKTYNKSNWAHDHKHCFSTYIALLYYGRFQIEKHVSFFIVIEKGVFFFFLFNLGHFTNVKKWEGIIKKK